MDDRWPRRTYVPTVLVALASLLICGPAVAVELAFNQRTAETLDLHTCGVYVSGSDQLSFANGVGIVFGLDGNYIDGTEWIEFEFDEPQRGVSFSIVVAIDVDGDGTPGRAVVEAFDSAGSSLGIRMISGVGDKELASFYGSAMISRVVVRALADGIRIGSLEYAEVGAVEIDLQNGGYMHPSAPDVSVCSVRAVGSTGIYYSHFQGPTGGGMGVIGGAGATQLDGSEWMRLEFPYPVDELVLESELESLDGDLQYGEGVLFAYDESGAFLGSTSLQRNWLFGGSVQQTLDVVDRVGAGGIAQVEIFSLGDARRLERVVYAPEPRVGSAVAIMLLACLARHAARPMGRRGYKANA